MKFYVDKNLQLRASDKGWPDINHWHPGPMLKEYYNKALEKAKAESVPIKFTSGLHIHNTLKGIELKPDTFIELPVEVEFEEQMRGAFSDWVYFDSDDYKGQAVRTIARLKPENIITFPSDASLSESNSVDIPSAPFPQNPQVSAVQGPWTKEYQNDIDISFYKEQARILTEQLEAAEKRCKELEEKIMSPVSDLERLESYTRSGPHENRYEFNLQVWGAGNNNIFVTKGDVEMWSGGGYDTATEALVAALAYMKRVKAQTFNQPGAERKG